jgi:hypothetical protein
MRNVSVMRWAVALLATLALGTGTLSPAVAAPEYTPRSLSLVKTGKQTLVLSNSYRLTACFQYSTPTALFAQAADGQWQKLDTAPGRRDASYCQGAYPYRMDYFFTLTMLGAPFPNGPTRLQMATGYANPKFPFTAGVWPNWQACMNARANDCS